MEVSCTLPSQTPGYHFDVHLTGTWQGLSALSPHQNPHAAAADHALTVARSITTARQLSEVTAVETSINSRLGQPADLAHAPVRLLQAHVHLTADPHHAAEADRLLREQHQAEQHARNEQRRLQRAHDLREALLGDPSLALAYWFLDHPETIGTATVQRVEQLIASAASYAPQTTWVQVAQLLQEFVRELSNDARQHLITGMAHIFDRHGHHDRARQLRAVAEDMSVPPDRGSTGARETH
ncbi:hypothetical protein [Streptomyces smyrnaeus]|uniref:hypothetical protein n=1 Tax=Streptomyces smyrnaeus TaxID=1387713 RepID=UPI0036CE6D6C